MNNKTTVFQLFLPLIVSIILMLIPLSMLLSEEDTRCADFMMAIFSTLAFTMLISHAASFIKKLNCGAHKKIILHYVISLVILVGLVFIAIKLGGFKSSSGIRYEAIYVSVTATLTSVFYGVFLSDNIEQRLENLE